MEFFTYRDDIVARGSEDNVIFTTFRFNCAEDMKLALLLGYDGPVKVWIDGQEYFHDPNGTTPAVAGKTEVAFGAAAGDHAITVALGTNGGNAWGVFMRLQRCDVTPRQIQERSYILPILLDQ